ncbi:YopX family protein [Bacteroides sp.]|uniref:YopX family protein n=1 Tax=Bacteroides sp. TaxID=29523 RepID=UPI002582CEA3|nr:YopX family protein [Bacteroides sp.]
MNRKIKFRGKTESNQFIFGDLIQYENGDTAIWEKEITGYGYEATQISNRTKVDNGTIGQFTGLHDKNGKEIYEGDIISNESYKGIVVYKNGSFVLDLGKSCGCVYLFCLDSLLVIGNIYDNPELLESKK